MHRNIVYPIDRGLAPIRGGIEDAFVAADEVS